MHLKQICSPPILAVAEPSGANPVMIPSPWIRQCHRSMVSLQENYFICQETPPKTLPPSWLEVYPRKHILSEYWPIHVTATVTVSTFNSHFPNELDRFSSVFSLYVWAYLFRERTCAEEWPLCTGRMSFLSPNLINSVRAWLHPFFTGHQLLIEGALLPLRQYLIGADSVGERFVETTALQSGTRSR